MKQRTHFLSTSQVFSCATHQSCFSESFAALPCSPYCCEEVVENPDGSRPTQGGPKFVSCHTSSGSSSVSQIRRYIQNTFFCISIAITLVVDCLYPLQQRNDHVWSCCRYPRSDRKGRRKARRAKASSSALPRTEPEDNHGGHGSHNRTSRLSSGADDGFNWNDFAKANVASRQSWRSRRRKTEDRPPEGLECRRLFFFDSKFLTVPGPA